MRRLTANTFTSLDGVMQAPGGPDEDPAGGFPFGGWSVPYWDELSDQVMTEQFDVPHEFVLGRRTYEIFASYWPHQDGPTADVLNKAAKHVASRTLGEVTWSGAKLMPGDAGDAVAALKDQDGPELNVQGSADLLQTLWERDLVDEFTVWTLPVLLGRGKHLFGDRLHPGALRVVDTRTTSTGAVVTTYARDGEVRTGSF